MNRAAAIWLAIALSACATKLAEAPVAGHAGPAPAAASAAPVEIPPLLRSCALAPAPPPKPRTIEQVAAWAGELADAYADCAYRLHRLVDLVNAAK